MPCVIQIKENIIKKIEEMSGDYVNKKPSYINILENTINNNFKEPVIKFLKQTDDTYLSNIKVSDKLVDEYFQNELIVEESKESYEQGTSTLVLNNNIKQLLIEFPEISEKDLTDYFNTCK